VTPPAGFRSREAPLFAEADLTAPQVDAPGIAHALGQSFLLDYFHDFSDRLEVALHPRKGFLLAD
jgi:hypothetical protein